MRFNLNTPDELFSADFANGLYRLGGVPSNFAGIIGSDASWSPAMSANLLVPGKGIVCATTGATVAAYPTLSAAAFAALKANPDAILVMEVENYATGSGYAFSAMQMGYPTSVWALGAYCGREASGRVTNIVSIYANDDYLHPTEVPIQQGPQKLAFRLGDDGLAVSVNGSHPYVGIPSDPAVFASATLMGVSFTAMKTNGSPGEAIAILKSITAYKAGDPSLLAELSRP